MRFTETMLFLVEAHKSQIPKFLHVTVHHPVLCSKRLCKGKGKVRPRTGHEGPEWEQMYSSTLPSTSALDGVGGKRHAPAALSPGKTRYPLYRRLGGPQERSGRVRKNIVSTGIRSPDRPALTSRYTDWAIPTPLKGWLIIIRNLSNDRSKASSKTIPAHSAI